MSTSIAIGFGQAPLISDAVYQACLAVRSGLRERAPDLLLVLATPSHIAPDMLSSISYVLKPKRLIGCSTASIILSEGYMNHGIALLGICSDDISFGIASSVPNAPADERQAGFEWARRLLTNAHSQRHDACILFADHLYTLSAEFILGMQEVLGNISPIIGAVASDDFKFQKTTEFFGQDLSSQALLGLLIDSAKISIANKHGFKPLGKPRRVTQSEHNIIMQIDGQPAINIYKEFLGKEAEALNRNVYSLHSVLYPLGFYIEHQKAYLVKNAIDITMEGSIVVSGEVPPNAEVHLMIGNKDSCRQSALEAALQVKASLGNRQAKLILIIESAGRQRVLKNNAHAQILSIKEILGHNIPMIGFYSYGEITPLLEGVNKSHLYFQNGSITIIAIE